MDKHYLKDLKKAYRILLKERRNYKRGDERRTEINDKMSSLKEKIARELSPVAVDPKKQELIDKIAEFRRAHGTPMVDMTRFSYEDLEFHLLKITGKVRTRDEYNAMKGKSARPAYHSPIEAGIQRLKGGSHGG